MEKNKLWYRSRGLESMEERFGSNLIQKFIKKRLNLDKKVRVLEIGFGEGKCLLDLRVLFPSIELYGLNEDKRSHMANKKDFLRNSEKFGINIPNKNLPKPYFYDAGNGLKFKSNFFNLVISQVSFHYVGNKARLIEEIWRVLKPEGKAFLHIDRSYKRELPDFMKTNPETPLFIIYKNSKLVKLSEYLRKFKKRWFNLTLQKSKHNSSQRNLLITKNISKNLNLGLKYDGNATLYLTKLKNTDKYKIDSGIWWGTRSVFRVKK